MGKNIAFVPLRGGSKSIVLKNIRTFLGKPLTYWVLKSLEYAKSIDVIVVATDSDDIKNIVAEFNFSKVVVYDREAINAKDTSSTESVLLEYLLKNKHNANDNIVLAQATSPFTRSADFDQAINILKNSHADSLLSVVTSKRFYWDENGPVNYNFEERPRRQDFQGLFLENGAIYINSIRNITKHNNRLSGKICYYIMPEHTGYEIDEEHDWVIAEAIMRSINKEKRSLNKIKLFATDIDGVMTDSGMYYTERGDEIKKFNTKDGMGLEMLRNQGIITVIITSENTNMVYNRGKKLKVDYVYQGVKDKLRILKDICEKLDIRLSEVAYIGDDINDIEVLQSVGLPACPLDSDYKVKSIDRIKLLTCNGGQGVVRELSNFILDYNA